MITFLTRMCLFTYEQLKTTIKMQVEYDKMQQRHVAQKQITYRVVKINCSFIDVFPGVSTAGFCTSTVVLEG